MNKELSRRQFLAVVAKWGAASIVVGSLTTESGRRILDSSNSYHQQADEKKKTLTQAKQDYHDSRDPAQRILLKENVVMSQQDSNEAQSMLESSEGGFVPFYGKWPMAVVGIPTTFISIYKTVTSVTRGWKAYKRYTVSQKLKNYEKSFTGVNLEP